MRVSVISTTSMSRHMLRRNDIVNPIARARNGGAMMGRVWRRVDDHHVVVLDVGSNVTLYHEDELILCNDYKDVYKFCHQPGNPYGNPVRFIRMTSLKQLKKLCQNYSPIFGGSSDRHQKRWTEEERMKALRDLRLL